MKHQWKQKQQPSGRIAITGKKEGAILEPISHYEDGKVRFSIKNCDIGKYCIRHIDDNEIAKLYKRLGYLEQLTWRQLDQLPREDGLTTEIDGSFSHTFLKNKHPLLEKFGHLRVNGTRKPFRIFIARDKDFLYLLLFDKDGSIHHH